VKNETRTFYQAAVSATVERIFAGLDEALDLTALARAAALSPLHFHRIFRGMLGETPLELHRRLRLERAADELANGDAPVTRIAFRAGYDTHESFTRAFGEHYGMPPSTFRQSASAARPGCAGPPRLGLASPSGLHFRAGQRPDPIVFVTKGDFLMNVDLKELPGLRVAALRHIGPYNRISEAFERLGDIAGRAGLIGRPGTQMLGIYHDDPEATPAAELRSDAGLSIPEDAALPKGLEETRIPAGRYAVATHVGPYTGLPDAWSKLMGSWLPETGHRLGSGPSFEIYRNTPMDTAPADLRTELYIPVV